MTFIVNYNNNRTTTVEAESLLDAMDDFLKENPYAYGTSEYDFERGIIYDPADQPIFFRQA